MQRSDFVIVIGRQFGSGGRKLGKILASRLGLPYYDKEMLSKASEELGFRPDLFEKVGEKRPSLFASVLGANYGSSSYFASGAMHNSTLYQMQSDVIRRLIESPCVIVGRTADYIGRGKTNLVSIFLHADDADRIARIRSRSPQVVSDSQARELMSKYDNDRMTYYNYFTGRKWGDAATYHLSLHTSGMTLEQAADVVLAYIDARIAAMEK